MVTTPNFDLDIDTTLGGNNASDYIIPSQKAIKSYVDNNSGSTVDQTFDATSQAAQSGIAIAGELIKYPLLASDEVITGVYNFKGQKKIKFTQSSTSDKLGFTLYSNSNVEKGYLEYNPSNTVDSVPLMTLGNYATASAGLTHVGFRKYSSVSGSSGAYNLLAPLISDARTPFNLTTTYTNFYLPLGFTDGNTTVKTAKSGLVNLSTLLPTVPTNISAFTNDSGYITSSDLSNYLQATNGNTAYTNTGTETTMGYTDTSTYEMYGVVAGKNTTYGTGIILGAQNGGSGYMSTLTTSGLTLMNATNPPNIQTAILTVSNNNLAINGSEVALKSDIPDDEIFIAEYGVTSYADILSAYNDGKILFVNYSTIINTLTAFNSSTNTFTFSSCYNHVINNITIDNVNNWNSIQYYQADTDLSNLSATGKTVIDGQWVEANEGIISSNTSLSGSTPLTKRITLPDDGYKYEVLIRGSIYTSSTSGKEVFLKVKGNEDSYDRYIARCITRTSSAMYSSGTTLITASYVASNQTNLTIARDSSWGGNCSELTVVAYRRIGTNT